MNLSCDLIEVWPLHLDYPLHRQFIRDNRSKFNRIIIVFSNMNTSLPDQRVFIIDAMKEDQVTYTTLPPAQANEDWRDKAVNIGLSMSNAPWVWFTEQDFFPKEGFWDQVKLGVSKGMSVIGVTQEKRLHPCCLFVKRDLVDKTNRDFGVVKDGMDHFGIFTQELDKLVQGIQIIPPQFYTHMNGLSQNMFLLMTGQQPNYQPEEFKDYARACLKVVVPLSDDFIKLFEKYL